MPNSKSHLSESVRADFDVTLYAADSALKVKPNCDICCGLAFNPNLIKFKEKKMEMEISFPGGKKVDSSFKGHTVQTDQSEKQGGEGSAPSPSELFLASVGTCAGYYAMTFCEKRKLNIDKLKVKVDFQANKKTSMIEKIVIYISPPPDFPQKYKDALIKAVDLCYVKKHLAQSLEFEYVLE